MFWRFKRLSSSGMLKSNLSWKKLEFLYSSLPKYASSCMYDCNVLKNRSLIDLNCYIMHRSTKELHHISNRRSLWNNAKILHELPFSPLYERSFRCMSTSNQTNPQTVHKAVDNVENKDFSTSTNLPSKSEGIGDCVPTQTFGDAYSAVPVPDLDAPVMVATSKQMLILPDFPFVQGAEASIFYTHMLSGLPWWSAIVLTSLVSRVVLILPLNVYQQHNMAKVEAQGPELKALARKIQVEVGDSRARYYWTVEKTRVEFNKKMKVKVAEMRVRDNCHPMKNIAAMYLQIPLFLSLSYALRNMSVRAMNPTTEYHSDYVGLTEQGAAWFPDLTATDTTLILPLMLGAVTLFNVEMHYLNAPEVTKYRKYLTYFLRTVSLIMVPICSTLPTAMAVYWVSSGMFTASTNILLNYSSFRRLMNLPKSSFESSQPIRDLAGKARKRYFKS